MESWVTNIQKMKTLPRSRITASVTNMLRPRSRPVWKMPSWPGPPGSSSEMPSTDITAMASGKPRSRPQPRARIQVPRALQPQ